ncbi:MAG: NAD-dependent epimerase/dehydratase family protein [Phycisphaerae bacterium]|nr:NAD-dependent epimerase/dehydratase family protein [Phycisphaerae bacterium]
MNLITGATGLLGSHIAEQLVKRGEKVRVLVRRGSDTRFVDSLGVEKVFGDLTDRQALGEACEGVRVVYHSAAKVGDWGHWDEFQRVTIDGTRYLLEASDKAKVQRFLHISSISAYGYVDGEGVILDETAPLGQNLYRWSYYSKAKVIAEQLVWDFHRKDKLAATVIRPSWLYGPRDRASIGRLVDAIQSGKAKIIGDGLNKLSLAYAGNVAEGAILAANKDEAKGEAYNCCSDGDITLQGYFDLIAKALGASPVRKHVPYKIAKFAGFTMECVGRLTGRKEPPMVSRYAVWLMGRRIGFSTAKVRKLGWTPTVDYETGIPLTVKWYLDEK